MALQGVPRQRRAVVVLAAAVVVHAAHQGVLVDDDRDLRDPWSLGSVRAEHQAAEGVRSQVIPVHGLVAQGAGQPVARAVGLAADAELFDLGVERPEEALAEFGVEGAGEMVHAGGDVGPPP